MSSLLFHSPIPAHYRAPRPHVRELGGASGSPVQATPWRGSGGRVGAATGRSGHGVAQEPARRTGPAPRCRRLAKPIKRRLVNPRQDGPVTPDADTFAKFVTVLSASLDDHALHGGDLAARLYLSRSHFDRIIGAIAGEPPGRFRRRILLERAAFRLRTTEMSVLDVAVEAGY